MLIKTLNEFPPLMNKSYMQLLLLLFYCKYIFIMVISTLNCVSSLTYLSSIYKIKVLFAKEEVHRT